MIDILRTPDSIKITSENPEAGDALVRIEDCGGSLKVFLKADSEKVKFVRLFWSCAVKKSALVLGDRWERSYSDLEWLHPDSERFMPWYFALSDGAVTECAGVKVRPSSFVCFTCGRDGVTAFFDVRNGSCGVELGGRELCIGELVYKKYEDITAFRALSDFCSVMCTDPVLPALPVYGSNNWYYAYGNSSRDEILADARLLADETKGLENRPFMVIDDGWSVNRCAGPWLPKESYGDMKTLADEFKAMKLRPGIWVRLLRNDALAAEHPEMALEPKSDGAYLDPSVEATLDYVRSVIKSLKDWGYELIKHDYSTYDIFGSFGGSFKGSITLHNNWKMHDTTRTNAEIVLDFYKTVREAAGDTVIIGCNTIGHLCAGLVELQRTGDDTSGRNFNTTRRMGVNTLAFRLAQNKKFFMIDADCVGIKERNILWSLNKQWLDLLAKSGSPLFVSCQPGVLNADELKDLADAFARSSVQNDDLEPLDWFYTKYPEEYLLNGEKITYDWYTGDIKNTPYNC